ncbi:MAG: PAS domain S-box protein [Anaerolineales bacterium]
MVDEIKVLCIAEDKNVLPQDMFSSVSERRANLPAFSLMYAKSADAGLNRVKTEPFDIILLDHRLKADALLPEIRSIRPRAPLLMVANPGELKEVQKEAGQFADKILTYQEVDSPLLIHTLLDAVEKRDLEDSLQKAHIELEKLLVEFTSLRQASLHLTSNLELSPTLDAILENALHLISADDAHIFLYQDGELHFGSALFDDDQQKEPFQNPRDHGLTYKVARQGEKIVVNDVMKHPIFKDRRWDGAIIGIPLKIGQEVQGVMNLAFQHSHTFTEEEQRILELFADQAAIAIHNARLYEKAKVEIGERKQAEEALRESEERYRKLFDSSKDAIMTLEPPDWRFTSGNNAILDMFKVQDVAEFTHHTPGDLSPPTQPDGRPSKEKALEMIRIALEKGSHFFEWEHQRVNGENFPATVLLTRVDLGEKRFLQATVRDITKRKDTERSLKESEEKYRSLFERVPVGLYQTTPQGKIMDANPALAEMLGYPNRESLLGVKASDIFVSDEDRQDQLSILKKEEVLPDYELKLRRRDGSEIWVRDSARAVKDENGETLYFQGSLVNITERVQLQREVEKRRLYLEGVLESTLSALITLDTKHRILEWNAGAEKVFGYTAEEAVGRDLDALIANPEGEILSEASTYTNQILNQEIVPPTETVRYDKWGNPINVVLTGAPIQVGGDLVGIVASYTDITKQKSLEKEIKHMATHDALTGLPNRRLFNERIGLEIAHAERNQERVGVMFIDLDNFKEINDTYGHSTGDVLLKKIGSRLVNVLRKSDTVARMGGDEFLLITPEMETFEDAYTTAERVLKAMQDPFTCNGNQVKISFSIGIAIYPDHGEDVDTLTKHADSAMYQAKEQGGSTYQMHASF